MKLFLLLLSASVLQTPVTPLAQNPVTPPLQTVTPSPATVAPSTIRIYNATQSSAGTKLDFLLDTTPSAQAVDPGSITGPFAVGSEATTTLSVRKTGTANDLTSQSITMGGNDHVVVVSGDPDQQVTIQDLALAQTPSNATKAQISVLNAAPDNVDIYLIPPNTVIDRVQPAVSAMNPGSTGVVSQGQGNYVAVLTAVGIKDSPIISKSFGVKPGDRVAIIALSGGTDQPDQIAIVRV